jgi:hypothetical protein
MMTPTTIMTDNQVHSHPSCAPSASHGCVPYDHLLSSHASTYDPMYDAIHTPPKALHTLVTREDGDDHSGPSVAYNNIEAAARVITTTAAVPASIFMLLGYDTNSMGLL